MIDYPKEDREITICTADGVLITGFVNIAGRSLSVYLQDSEPDIILYDAQSDKKKQYKTLMLSKREAIWISTSKECEKGQFGNWKKLSFKMVGGQIVVGEIDITGYDRVSDYIQSHQRRFYELFDSRINGENRKTLFISRHYTVWKEPL